MIMKKKTFIILTCMLLCVLAVSCSKSKGNASSQPSIKPSTAIRTDSKATAKATASAQASEANVTTDKASPAKTNAENTPIPAVTVQPGKGTYSGGILSADPISAKIYNESVANGIIQLNTELSLQFFATSTFSEIALACPSFNDNLGTMTFSLYAWQGTYDKTLASKVIKTDTFVDYADNSMLKLTFTEALPDGEYLLVLTTETSDQGVGVWTKTAANEAQRVYVEGEVVEDVHLHLSIAYTNTPNKLYGPLSAN